MEDPKKLMIRLFKALLVFSPMYLIPIIPCRIYGWGVQGYFVAFAVTAAIYIFIVVRIADRYNIRL